MKNSHHSHRLLICTGLYQPDIGGPATYSKILYDELPKRGIGVKVLSFGEVRHLPKIIRHIVYFFKVLKLGKNAEIIFAQDPVSVGLPSCLASKILRKKFVLKIVGDYAWEQYQIKSEARSTKSETNFKFKTLEEFQNKKFDLMTELRRKIERWVAKKADKIIVPSEYLKKIILMWEVDENKIRVIYNAFDAPQLEISKEEAREKLNLSGIILISAGRLVSWKGFDALIEIMPEVLEEIPDAKLIIIGEGPEKQNLESRIQNLELGNNIILKGQIPHEELMNYLRAGDIFVLNTGYEGLSHQILEAMVMEIPVITTNVGGNPELIKNRDNGILIEYKDKTKIKEAVIALCKNRDLGEKLAKNAKLEIAKFNKESMIDETIKILS